MSLKLSKIRGSKKFKIQVGLGHAQIKTCYCGEICFDERPYCSSVCAGNSKNTRKKCQNTCLDKYGTKNPFQSEKVKAKIKISVQEAYGVDNPSKSEIVKKRMRKTFIQNYGVDNPAKNELIKKKMRRTCRQRYGVSNIAHDRDMQKRASESRFKPKKYRINGKVIKVQGYEPQGITFVKNLGVAEERFVFGNEVPSFRYTRPNGNKAIYHPDFMVTRKKRGPVIVEVKSVYTIIGSKYSDEFEINKRKAKAVLREYDYVVLVMTNDGKNIKLPKNWLELSRKELDRYLKAKI